jgi:hypothetical protein
MYPARTAQAEIRTEMAAGTLCRDGPVQDPHRGPKLLIIRSGQEEESEGAGLPGGPPFRAEQPEAP